MPIFNQTNLLRNLLDVVVVPNRVLAVVNLLLTTLQNVWVRLKFAILERRSGAAAFGAVVAEALLKALAQLHLPLLIRLIIRFTGLAKFLVRQTPLEWRFDLVLSHQFVKFLLVFCVGKLNLEFARKILL